MESATESMQARPRRGAEPSTRDGRRRGPAAGRGGRELAREAAAAAAGAHWSDLGHRLPAGLQLRLHARAAGANPPRRPLPRQQPDHRPAPRPLPGPGAVRRRPHSDRHGGHLARPLPPARRQHGRLRLLLRHHPARLDQRPHAGDPSRSGGHQHCVPRVPAGAPRPGRGPAARHPAAPPVFSPGRSVLRLLRRPRAPRAGGRDRGAAARAGAHRVPLADHARSQAAAVGGAAVGGDSVRSAGRGSLAGADDGGAGDGQPAAHGGADPELPRLCSHRVARHAGCAPPGLAQPDHSRTSSTSTGRPSSSRSCASIWSWLPIFRPHGSTRSRSNAAWPTCSTTR